MLSLPKAVRIGGKVYKVKPVPEIKTNRGDDLLGRIDYYGSRIDMNTTLQDQQSADNTLLHECLHGLFHHMAIKSEQEEEIVEKLGGGLIMLFKDNPELLKLLR